MKNRIAVVALVSVGSVAGLGCGQTEKPYEPKPAFSGDKRPTMPAVPPLPNKPKKDGDAYTVYGASHDMRSLVHEDDFKDKQDVAITGYIIATNYEKACGDEKKLAPDPGENCVPLCAIHKTGKGDPDGCKAPVPTFWISDDPASTDLKNAIRVMGWASNFAQIFDVVEAIDRESDDAKKDAVEKQDVFFGVTIPVPIPIKGAKVKIVGSYSINYSRSTGGRASDPNMGIITYQKITYLEKPKERAYLPGMKSK